MKDPETHHGAPEGRYSLELVTLCPFEPFEEWGGTATMKRGDVLGHEFMGEVVEVGPAVDNLSVGDRVVVPFPIACGACAPCALVRSP